jgi:hypothetical protein
VSTYGRSRLGEITVGVKRGEGEVEMTVSDEYGFVSHE